MLSRQKRVTQLENFAPTTSQHDTLDELQTRSALSNDGKIILGKRKVDDESHSRPSKLISLPRDQNFIRSTETQKIEKDHQTGVNRSYHAFMTINQAGRAVIAHENAFPDRLVAIKRVRPVNETSSFHFQPYKSNQVVNIVDTYVDGPEIVLIYEAMDISLRQMISVCPVHVSKIAAIFKEVVSGLDYLHQELSLIHGSLSCDTVLLNQDCTTKIANVGEALVKQIPYTRENVRIDIRSLGNALLETMEPATFTLEPNALVLRNRGNHDVQAFLTATESMSLEDLKKHPFLFQTDQYRSFASDVFRAVRVAGIGWDGVTGP